MKNRTQRVSTLVFQELCITLKKLEDPRLEGLTFTDVKMTKDLQLAKVYYSIFGEEHDRKAAEKALHKAQGMFKKNMAENLNLRYIPELKFYYDQTMEKAQRIEKILEKINKENGNHS